MPWDDPSAMDAALRPYKVMVRPLMSGLSRIAQHLKTSAFDQEEKDGGTFAFSALMYQYGGELDARVLVLMWAAGVTMPRLLEYLDRKASLPKETGVYAGPQGIVVDGQVVNRK